MKLFLGYFIFISSKLSIFDIKDVVDKISTYSNTFEDTIINPIYGFLFESTGGLNNIRFFSSQIDINYDIRNYAEDKSEDFLTALIIELFPSPTGIINHIRTSNSNFGFQFLQNKSASIEFLSDLFIDILLYNKIEKSKNYSVDALNKVRNSLSTKKNIIESRYLKLMTIHSFILNALDNKLNLENYVLRILNQIDIDKIEKLKTDICAEIIKICNFSESFPYSELNQPPSNVSLPIYDRKRNMFLEHKRFSDCADIILLHICNCLLYDPIRKCYSTEGLNVSRDLSLFYSKYNRLFTITTEIRKDWSRVIQGLDDFENIDDSDYKTHIIVYLKEKRNEVKSGIINMMNILIKIFNINHFEFWSDFYGLNIEKKLTDLFIKILKPGRMRVHSQNFKRSVFKERMDFIGSFVLDFIQPNDNTVSLKITYSFKHAEAKIYSCNNQNYPQSICFDFDSSSLTDIIFYNFVKLSMNSKINKEMDVFSRIYFSGEINSNEKKLIILEDICSAMIQTKSCKLNKILKLIISSIDLSNLNTKEIFLPFEFDNNYLSNEEIINAWLKSMKYNDLHKLWDKRVDSLNLESFNLNVMDIPNTKIPIVFDKLSKLESLILSGISSSAVETISECLAKLLNLQVLDLSHNLFDLYSLNIISKAITKINNLISLNLSNNNICAEHSQIISETLKNLKNLIYLNLSFNNLGSEGIKNIIPSLTQLKNLKHINLSKNYIDSLDAKHISELIRSINDLSSLDLSFNYLGSNGAYIILENLNNLEILDLRFNFLDSESLAELKYTVQKINQKIELRI